MLLVEKLGPSSDVEPREASYLDTVFQQHCIDWDV